jgi:LPS sulfotransferase NodH
VKFSLLDPRNGEAFDLPLSAGPQRNYVVASTPRTGSTLLCRLLWDLGQVGAPKEYLNPMQMRDWEVRLGESTWRRFICGCLRGPAVGFLGLHRWTPDELHRYLQRIRERRTSAEGLFGIKLHRHHFDQLFGPGKASLDEVVSPRQWIFLRREDRVAQAVSWARALQSGRWAAHQKFALPVVYRRRQIQRLVGLVDAQESAWETFFSAGKIEPLRLRYEDILEDRERSLRNVLDFLGVAGASEIALPEPDLERQSDALNQLWIERYRSES